MPVGDLVSDVYWLNTHHLFLRLPLARYAVASRKSLRWTMLHRFPVVTELEDPVCLTARPTRIHQATIYTCAYIYIRPHSTHFNCRSWSFWERSWCCRYAPDFQDVLGDCLGTDAHHDLVHALELLGERRDREVDGHRRDVPLWTLRHLDRTETIYLFRRYWVYKSTDTCHFILFFSNEPSLDFDPAWC